MEHAPEVAIPLQQQAPQRLGIADLVGFLVGFRSSIYRFVHAPLVLWFAAFLVFTAAVSREYDAVSLIDKPWDLLGPFGASIFLCTIIFVMLKVMMAFAGYKTQYADDRLEYRLFLSGYWLTAPLAWLYAFPVETVASEVDSLKFNLTALSVVSIWRVLLFSRVVSVLYAIPFWCSLAWILVPCMIIAFVFLASAILPMVSIMGGIRMTQSQAMLYAYQNKVAGIIFYSAIPVLIVSLLAIGFVRSKRPMLDVDDMPRTPNRSSKLSKGLWGLPALVLLILGSSAAYFQPRLWHAARIDELLLAGDFSEAIDRLQLRGRHGVPESWDPPPKFSKDKPPPPSMAKLIEVVNQKQPEVWINDLLLNQADEILFSQVGWNQGTRNSKYLEHMLPFSNCDLQQLADSLQLLAAIPRSIKDNATHETLLIRIVQDAIGEKAKKQNQETNPTTSPNSNGTTN